MGKLSGKAAVITGSTRGLGLAIAKAYAQEGAAVVVSSRTAGAVNTVVRDLRAAGHQATGLAIDVAQVDQVKRLAEHAVATYGHFDVWINNAGVSAAYGPTMGVPMEQFVQVVQTNILGTYYGSWVAMQHFLASDRGKLINLIGAGARKPLPMQNAYGSSKAWVRTFTLALAKGYKQTGVGVFLFQPGLVDTDMLRQIDVVPGYEQRLNVFPTIIRMWSNPPETPADKAVWLASAATDGKSGLEVKANGAGHFIAGALHEGWRRLSRQPGPAIELAITPVNG